MWRAFLRDQAVGLEAHRARLEITLEELETLAIGMTGAAETGYAALTAAWAAEIHRGDLRGVEQLLAHLEDGGAT